MAFTASSSNWSNWKSLIISFQIKIYDEVSLLVFGFQIFNRIQFQWGSYLYFIITKPTTTISAYNTLLYLSIIMLFWSIRGKIEIFNKKHIDTVTCSAQQCKSSSIYIAWLFGEIFFPQIFFLFSFFNRGKHFIVLLVYLSLPLTLILILPNTHLHLHNYVSTTTISLHNRWIIGFCPCITH